MGFALLIVALLCSSGGAISDGRDTLEQIWQSNSTDGRYSAQAMQRRDAYRDPDRATFSVIINDTLNDDQYTVGVSAGDEILNFIWSHGSAYVFVQGNDVYYVRSPELPPIKVTQSEESNQIPGSTDWVGSGFMKISPTDKYLAYESRTVSSKRIMMTTYSREYNYDYHYNMEYTKSGEPITSKNYVFIWSAETNESISMDVQLEDRTAFPYLYGLSWVTLHGMEVVIATWANRWQNETVVTMCSYENATCSLIYRHNYEPTQWALYGDYTDIVHSNSSIFFLIPEKRRDNSWQHIAKIDITTDFRFHSISILPSGDYDIEKIVAYRAEENIVVYFAQAPLPWNRHVYGTPAVNRSLLTEDRCLTCVHANCTYQEIDSPKALLGIDLRFNISCKGPSPHYKAVVSLNSSTLEPLETVILPPSDNQTLRNWTIDTLLLSSGYEANVKIYEGDSKLPSVPVILWVYGGPMHDQVTDEYKDDPRPIGYKTHAIVHVDVRGSGRRGWKYRSAIYGRLVTVEVEDTLEAMKLVLEKYPRLDPNRVAVSGWSYGGTMTAALVELAPAAFFKCAMVVAPVTNFLYYYAGYSERYMGDAPQSAYTDLTRDVSKFQNTTTLLVHGLRDDNVHFQNSAILMETLQEANIPFELMVYPNQDHHLKMKNKANEHMKQLFESFFSRCFA